MTRRRYSRRSLLAGAASVAAVGLAGCAGGPPEQVPVEMTDDFRFEPERVTVATGGTVTWENPGRIAHTVTAYADQIPDGAAFFASGDIESEAVARGNPTRGLIRHQEIYRHTFDVVGRYEYFCVPHEASGMVGTVRVR